MGARRGFPASITSDPLFPRQWAVHRTCGNVAEVLEHITVSEFGLAQRLSEISKRRGEPVRATPTRITARDIARIAAQVGAAE